MIPAIILTMAGLALMACGLSPGVLRVFAAHALSQAEAVESYWAARRQGLMDWRRLTGGFMSENCECGDPTPHTDHCGCCGTPITGAHWCARCYDHLGPVGLPPWERTYFGQYGKDCPFTEAGE